MPPSTLAELEGTRYDSWGRRQWRLWLLEPGQGAEPTRHQRWRAALGYLAHRLDRWAALPGDTHYDPSADLVWHVAGGRPGSIEGYAVPGNVAFALFLRGIDIGAWAATNLTREPVRW